MQLPRIPQALATLIVLSFCLIAHAEKQLLTDFQIQLDDSIGHSDSPLLTESYKNVESMPLENMPIESKYPTWIEDITLTLDYKMSPINPWQFNKSQKVTSETFAAKVNIGKLKTEFSETQRTDGMVITLDFHAECTNIPLTLNNDLTTFTFNITPINKGSKIVLQLDSSQINWPENAWKQGQYSCEGVKGFDKILAKEFEKFLKKPDGLQDKIFAELKKRVSVWEKDLNDKLFKKNYIQEDVSNYLTYFMPQAVMDSDARERLKMKGYYYNIYSNLNLASPDKKLIEFRSQPPNIDYQDGATFTIPVQALPQLIKDFAKNGNIRDKFTSNELDGFNEYMSSESQRSYTWPDLLRYNSGHLFKFEMTVLENPELYSLRQSGTGLTGRMKGRMVIHMFAPVSGRYWPYTEWIVPFDANIYFKVQEGKLTAQLGEGSYSWYAKFVPLYIKKWRPRDTKIDAKTIGEQIVSNMRKKVFSWDMPLWKLSDKARFKAAKLGTTNDHLVIYWDLQK